MSLIIIVILTSMKYMQTIIISPQNVKHSENYYEDEFSYLKDEIYKTAISLNEQTINLENDKKNLKKSLEDISHQLKTPLTSITLMTDKILSGNIDIKPAYNRKTKIDACKYCEYKTICRFDPKVNHYAFINNKSKEEILETLKD